MKFSARLLAVVLLAAFGLSAAAGVTLRQWQQTRMKIGPAVARSEQANHRQRARGQLLFTMHCARCHGDEGHGDAEGAEKLVPPPRDFAARPWRFSPERAAIERVTRDGIPGTAMPAFAQSLAPADVAAVADHVLTLSTPAETSQADDAFRAARFSRLAAPRPAPALSLASADGQELTLADLRGRVVLLNFWGMSCEHCLTRMPQLARFARGYEADEFLVVNICADDDDAAGTQEALAGIAPELVTHVDAGGLAVQRYEVTLLPTMWLLDREGRLIAKSQGARDWADPALAALVAQLLRQ